MPTFRRSILALAVALFAAGCGDKGKDDHKEEGHEHPPAPHGGEWTEVGAEVAHLEVIHDHVGGSMVVYVYGSDAKTPLAIAAPEVKTKGKDGKPVQFTLEAAGTLKDGKSDHWKGGHDALKTDPWDGRFSVVVNGKTYTPSLEPEGHSHK